MHAKAVHKQQPSVIPVQTFIEKMQRARCCADGNIPGGKKNKPHWLFKINHWNALLESKK